MVLSREEGRECWVQTSKSPTCVRVGGWGGGQEGVATALRQPASLACSHRLRALVPRPETRGLCLEWPLRLVVATGPGGGVRPPCRAAVGYRQGGQGLGLQDSRAPWPAGALGHLCRERPLLRREDPAA